MPWTVRWTGCSLHQSQETVILLPPRSSGWWILPPVPYISFPFLPWVVDLHLLLEWCTCLWSQLPHLAYYYCWCFSAWSLPPAGHPFVFTFHKALPLLVNPHWQGDVVDISHSLQKQSRVCGLFLKDPLLHTTQGLGANTMLVLYMTCS